MLDADGSVSSSVPRACDLVQHTKEARTLQDIVEAFRVEEAKVLTCKRAVRERGDSNSM